MITTEILLFIGFFLLGVMICAPIAHRIGKLDERRQQREQFDDYRVYLTYLPKLPKR